MSRLRGYELACVGRTVLGAVAALVVCVGLSPRAEAQFFEDFFKPKYRRPPAEIYHAPRPKRAAAQRPVQQEPRERKRIEAAPATPAEAPTKKASKSDHAAPEVAETPGPPLYAVVSIEDQHVSIYGANGLIERSDVSTGTESNPTPTGVFAIIQKSRWHESNLYSGAPMPFMQRITWSGVAMHQGQLPGYAASHGCIRLPAAFAERWFGMTKLGLRVLISPTDIAPEPFAHPNLPVPRLWTAPAIVAAVRAPVQSAALSNEALAALAAPQSATIELNPMTYAIAEKARAKFDLKAAVRAEGEAGDAIEAANLAAKNALVELRSAERSAAATYDRLAWFGLVGNRPPPSPRADFGDGLMVAIANNEQANTRLSEARLADAAARQRATETAEAEKQADARTEALKERIVEMSRRQETVSIFISRKDERLYVRQALRPVFDIPVSIVDADQPLGTHVLMALPPARGEKSVRWTALSMPVEVWPLRRVARLKRSSDIETGSIATAIPAETAAGALSRIQLPGEVMDQLAELVWAGSSIIISDQGINHETGVGTDFIVQTKH